MSVTEWVFFNVVLSSLRSSEGCAANSHICFICMLVTCITQLPLSSSLLTLQMNVKVNFLYVISVLYSLFTSMYSLVVQVQVEKQFERLSAHLASVFYNRKAALLRKTNKEIIYTDLEM